MKQNELYHFGIKGQKWGVRRYQNKDGTLTPAGKKRLAKDLKKDYKRNYDWAQPHKVSDNYRQKLESAIKSCITDDDKKQVMDAKQKWLSMTKETDKAERALEKIAREYGNKYYDNEISKHPDLYDTPRSKQKLHEYSIYDYGMTQAEKARPDLWKARKADEPYYKAYIDECRKVSDKLLGEYGDTKLNNRKWETLTIKDTVENAMHYLIL